MDFQVTAPAHGVVDGCAEEGGGRGLAGRGVEVDAHRLEQGLVGVGHDVEEMGHRSARIAAHVGHARLEQRLGDGEDALAAEHLTLAQLELLDFLGERPFHRSLYFTTNGGGGRPCPIRPLATASGSTTKRTARATRCSSPTASAATRACGSRTSMPSSAHHRLILWEPRGHARSDSPEDPRQVTFAHWTWDLHDLLDHLKIERGIVGGLSLGGGIATRFALAHPDRVRALLIIDSSSASGLPLGVDNIVMRAKSIEVTLGRRHGRHGRVRHRLQSRTWPGGSSSTRRRGRRSSTTTGCSRPSATPTPCGPSSRWTTSPTVSGEITAPTLLVCGDEDPSLGPMREIQKRIPHASFTLLSPAGHFANRDQPEAFNRAVSDFLKSLA